MWILNLKNHAIKQNGNALFLILIAVALFAALSYALTSSSRGGGDISREQALITASNIMQQLNQLNIAADRMNISGRPYDQIEFFQGGDCNPDYTLCSTGEDCLFAPEGGNVIVTNFPNDAFTEFNDGWLSYPGDTSGNTATNVWLDCDTDVFDWGSDTGTGGSGHERVMYLDNISEQVCRSYNEQFGYTGIPGDDKPSTDKVDKWTGCNWNSGSGWYSISHVIYSQ